MAVSQRDVLDDKAHPLALLWQLAVCALPQTSLGSYGGRAAYQHAHDRALGQLLFQRLCPSDTRRLDVSHIVDIVDMSARSAYKFDPHTPARGSYIRSPPARVRRCV
jgi:hypothetical protein